MELVQWLIAVLDEDEVVARAALPGPWKIANSGEVVASESESGPGDLMYVTCDSEGLLPSVNESDARHIALHDPTAVLADIAAKRRLLNLCAEWEAMALASPTTWSVLLVCAKNTRNILATAYAHRAGYQNSWA